MAAGMQSGRGGAEDSAVVGQGLGPQGNTSGGRGAASPVDDLRGIANDIAGAAVDQGKTLLDNARGTAASFADGRKDGVAQSVADLASSLRDSGGTFEDRPAIQAFVGSAADGLDQLADTIRERSFSEIYADVEDFARRQPLTVGAGALLAGFLLARFIKSSGDSMAEARTTAAGRRPQAQAGRSRRGGAAQA